MGNPFKKLKKGVSHSNPVHVVTSIVHDPPRIDPPRPPPIKAIIHSVTPPPIPVVTLPKPIQHASDVVINKTENLVEDAKSTTLGIVDKIRDFGGGGGGGNHKKDGLDSPPDNTMLWIIGGVTLGAMLLF